MNITGDAQVGRRWIADASNPAKRMGAHIRSPDDQGDTVMTAPSAIYKFRLGRDASGAYVGELVDDWGWVITMHAEVVEPEGIKVAQR
ncbi:MAG: hypothetical protein ACRYHQ_25130 [Janthinobacterium lividum]